METITLKMRFEYLKNVLEETSKIKITYPQFMEALFSKLEQEIRSETSSLENYHKKQIKCVKQKEFKYDYEK